MKNNVENTFPDGWVLTTLGDVTVSLRSRENPQNYPGLPFIGMEHIKAHTMQLLGTVPAESMKSSAVYFFAGDIIYGRLRPYLNKVFCPDFEGLCSAEFIVFAQTGLLNSKFLQYFLNSVAFVSFASHLNEGDRPRVDFSQLAPYRFPLPPLAEQQRIVEEIEKQFTRLDAAVAALKHVQVKLKRYRASVLKAACEGKLVPTEAELARAEGRDYERADKLLERILKERRAKWEDNQFAKIRAAGKDPNNDKWKDKYQEPTAPDISDLPQLPEGWTWASLESITEPLGGFAFDSKKFSDSGYQVLKMGNVKMGLIDTSKRPSFISDVSSEIVSKYLLGSGDIVVTLTGTRKKRDYGYVAVVKSENKLLLNQRLAR